ncbi:MAG: hypothetical protein K2Z25_18145 [Beijerinckiaceae bacterium]|nr:hypothetical protein [Beijerinckiaceae bacterium]
MPPFVAESLQGCGNNEMRFFAGDAVLTSWNAETLEDLTAVWMEWGIAAILE